MNLEQERTAAKMARKTERTKSDARQNALKILQ